MMNAVRETISVLLARNHSITGIGIHTILGGEPDIQIVAEAPNVIEAKRLIEELTPTVVLLDLHFVIGSRPSEITVWGFGYYPETALLVLTSRDRDSDLALMMGIGSVGRVSTDDAPLQLVDAIRRAARGEILFNAGQLARAQRWQREVAERWKSLTQREHEVFLFVMEGKSNQQIAGELCVAGKTVEKHLGNILSKLELNSRTEAVLWAVRTGLVDV